MKMSEVTGGNAEEEHYYGLSNQYQLSFFFSMFLILLMCSITFSNWVAHHAHWYFLPEAGATILIGIFGGIVCSLVNNTITHSLMIFDANTFFIALLPPIIFNSGYTMKRRYFFENITAIVTYAVVGTTISSFVVGLILYFVGYHAISLKLSLAEALSFGALISATDTVSVLAIFQELHVDPKLFYLVFGESSLNDAVAIVLFGSFSKFIGNAYTSSYLPIAILDFILIFFGSTCIGILFGVLSALLFKHFSFKGCLFHEVGVYIMFAYLPFLVCSIFDLSGVVAILFTGITMKHYTCNNLSEEGKETCGRMFNAISYVSETTIFLNLGLAVFALQVGYHWKFIIWTLIACSIGRALHVYPLSYLLNLKRSEETKITKGQQNMIWFGGLRGALCFALALEWPNEKRSEIIAATMVVVLCTLFLGGGATVPMLRLNKIKQLTPAEEIELDKTVRPMKRMRVLQFDNKYLLPFFTHMDPETGSFANRVHPTTEIHISPNSPTNTSKPSSHTAASVEDFHSSSQDNKPLRPNYSDEDDSGEDFSTINVNSR